MGPASDAPAMVRCAVASPASAGAEAWDLPAPLTVAAEREAGAPGVPPRDSSSGGPFPVPPRVSFTGAVPVPPGAPTVAGLLPNKEETEPVAAPTGIGVLCR